LQPESRNAAALAQFLGKLSTRLHTARVNQKCRRGDQPALTLAARHFDQPAEPTECIQHTGPHGRSRLRFDPANQLIAGVDIGAGLMIVQ
jgi:hypothetical protein